MTLPTVTLTELDGALGSLPEGAKALAIIGTSTLGPIATPATYANKAALVTAFGKGPLVEAAAFHIETKRLPVLVIRATANTAATNSAVVVAGVTGTSIVTITGATLGNDDYEVVVKVLTGGTIGVAGIVISYSLDRGNNFSAPIALGTAVAYVIAEAGTLSFSFAAGTLVAGDTWNMVTTGPNYDSTALNTALDALGLSTVAWEECLFANPLTAAMFDAIEVKFAGFAAGGKRHFWIGNNRFPTVTAGATETEAAYLTAAVTEYSAKASTMGGLCAGVCSLTSAVTGRKQRRPVAWPVGSLEASVSEEIHIAALNVGRLVGVSIRDANGNPDRHDETANPGLDDARFTVLRTFEDFAGIYVNKSRLFSAAGSDFEIVPYRRVMNIAESALQAFLMRRLHVPIRVSKTTGYIYEQDALEIESGANATLRSVLMAKPKASAATFQLSRTDNLLSTKTLTGQARVIPLAYPAQINVNIGFANPALQIVAS